MSNLQLTGEIMANGELDRLRQLSEHLSNELNNCRDAFQKVKLERDALMQATSGLRRLLAPLWGELQNAPVGVEVTGSPASNARLDSAKRRMPGKPTEFIDLLLEHGPMNVTNFVTLARCSKQTAYNTLSKLTQAGIVQNNGGKYFFKEQ